MVANLLHLTVQSALRQGYCNHTATMRRRAPALLGIAALFPVSRANASGESQRKHESRGPPPRSALRQGVEMIVMFPIVIAVTVLLAMGEVAMNEARRNRFAEQ
jgi:hypothetical protein